jgi:hypothetical protein
MRTCQAKAQDVGRQNPVSEQPGQARGWRVDEPCLLRLIRIGQSMRRSLREVERSKSNGYLSSEGRIGDRRVVRGQLPANATER